MLARQRKRRSSSCFTSTTPSMKHGNSSNCVHWLYAVRTGTLTSIDFSIRDAMSVSSAYFFFLRLDAARRDGLGGTFAPLSRASDRPMAMACLRLFTVRPLRPLFSVPRLRRRIADSTVFCAFLPYFRGMDSPPRAPRSDSRAGVALPVDLVVSLRQQVPCP